VAKWWPIDIQVSSHSRAQYYDNCILLSLRKLAGKTSDKDAVETRANQVTGMADALGSEILP